MSTVSLQDAKAHLSDLLDRAAAGEEILFSNNGIPNAKLVALPQAKEARRPAGALGATYIAPDFDAPDPDIVTLFGGGD